MVGAGGAFGEPAKSHKTWSVILSCMMGVGIGIGLRLLLGSNPEIITSILSPLRVVGMAIWNALQTVADAIAEFVRYFKSMTF
jgi:hypothetical protein